MAASAGPLARGRDLFWDNDLEPSVVGEFVDRANGKHAAADTSPYWPNGMFDR